MLQNSAFSSFFSLLLYRVLLDLSYKKSKVVFLNFLQFLVVIWLWLELGLGTHCLCGDRGTVGQGSTGNPVMNSQVLEAVSSTGHSSVGTAGLPTVIVSSATQPWMAPNPSLGTGDCASPNPPWAQKSGSVIPQCSSPLQPHRPQDPPPAPGMAEGLPRERQAGGAEQPTHPRVCLRGK